MPADHIIQRIGFTFGLPCESISTSSARISFRIASRQRMLMRRHRPDRNRRGEGRLVQSNGFIVKTEVKKVKEFRSSGVWEFNRTGDAVVPAISRLLPDCRRTASSCDRLLQSDSAISSGDARPGGWLLSLFEISTATGRAGWNVTASRRRVTRAGL